MFICISEKNNPQMNNAKDIDIVMPIYNLTKYRDNYSKTSGSLWQYYRDELAVVILNSKWFNCKISITGKALADGNTTDVEIAVPIKYFCNFWRTLEMPRIKCEINLI